MLDFILLLRTRYQAILNHIKEYSAHRIGYENSLRELIFAEAFLKKNELIQLDPQLPIQVVILGPTQAGKSTLINLLTREKIASVSPLAGFTVQPHGICYGIEFTKTNWLNDFFSSSQKHLDKNASQNRNQSFVFEQAKQTNHNPLGPCIIWDTPDFDSIDAENYQETVLQAAALADVVVLIVSKDKYADQSVWDMMALLESVAYPTLVCINKVPTHSEPILIESFLAKWKSVRNDTAPMIQTLSYQDQKGFAKTLDQELFPLVEQVNKAISQVNRDRYPQQVKQFIEQNWTRWVEPIKNEHHALEEWHEVVNTGIANTLDMYKRDFLDHPQYNETFQRALIELLSLLEIPALASAFVQVRRVVTWPLRQTIKLGKTFTRSNSAEPNLTQEIAFLEQIGEHFLLQLSETVLNKIEETSNQDTWWTPISAQLRTDKRDLLNRYKVDVSQYYNDFQPEIENAAQRLFQKLEAQPAILNSLRATRVTTDAIAVALAIKTSGLGVHDVVITPAVLSITSMLTESALGGYMNRVVAELKHRQFEIIKSQLFDKTLKDRLLRLPENLEQTDRFGITQEILKVAENNLRRSPTQ